MSNSLNDENVQLSVWICECFIFQKLLASVFALFLKYSDDRLKRCMEDVVKFTVLGKPLASIVVQ